MSRIPWLRGRWKWLAAGALVVILPAVVLYALNRRKVDLILDVGAAGGSLRLEPLIPESTWPTFSKFGLYPAEWPPVFWRADELHLGRTPVTGENVAAMVEPVNRLGGIRTVEFHWNSTVTPDVLAPLARLHDLERVVLPQGSVDDGDLAAIARVGRLRELDVALNPEVTVEGLKHLSNLPRLERLRITYTGVRGPEVIDVLKSMPALKEVHLGGEIDPTAVDDDRRALEEALPGVAVKLYVSGQPLSALGQD